MISKEEIEKIRKLNKTEQEYNQLYEEVRDILDNEFSDAVDFSNGDSIGNIVSKDKIPKSAQYNKDGTYVTYQQHGEDWGDGTVYIPLSDNEYLEVYYCT